MKLKHADKANKGQFIRSLDFAHLPDTYIEGMVLETNAPHPEQGVPSYKIIVTRDVREGMAYTGKGHRVGHVGWVAHEMAYMESEDRVQLVTFEDGDVTDEVVKLLYIESDLRLSKRADVDALVANANNSARIAREGLFAEQPNPRTLINQWIAMQLEQAYLLQQEAAREQ